MGKNKEKTNVMRILDQKKIAYESYSYVDTGAVSGIEVAEVLGENPDMVFKTLVTVGKSKTNYVFVIPVNCELDLKKAAHAVKEKRRLFGNESKINKEDFGSIGSFSIGGFSVHSL